MERISIKYCCNYSKQNNRTKKLLRKKFFIFYNLKLDLSQTLVNAVQCETDSVPDAVLATRNVVGTEDKTSARGPSLPAVRERPFANEWNSLSDGLSAKEKQQEEGVSARGRPQL